MRAIDLFAGAGGMTEAACQAGLQVVWAANHWPLAVEWHARNHPGVVHACQDLHQTDWRTVPAHDLVLASPACQGHSQAASRGGDGTRGSAPAHDQMRATAWAVVSCLEVWRPPLAVVENTLGFTDWVLYPAWSQALEALGYTLGVNQIDAADTGVPQNRVRLFLTLTRSRAPLLLRAPAVEHVPIRGFLDQDDARAPGWKPVLTKTSQVRARVARGRTQFDAEFLTQHVTNHPGRSLDRPIGTITTKSQWALVRRGSHGDEMRMLRVPELARAMTFPDHYQFPANASQATHLAGNAVPPRMGCWVLRQILARG